MNKKEIAKLLESHPDQVVNEHLVDYTTKKTTGISLLVVSVITAFFAKSRRKNSDETHDIEKVSTPFLTASSLSFIIGLFLLVTADTSFQKSKDAYLNPLADSQAEQINC